MSFTNLKPVIFSFLLLGISVFSVAQQKDREVSKSYVRNMDKADAFFKGYVYVKAIEHYKKVLDISKKDSLYAFLKIADSYRLVNKNHEARQWYEKVAGTSIMTARDKAHYAQILVLNGEYEQAKKIADELGTGVERLDKANLANEIKIDTAAYFMDNVQVNSESDDFSPAYFEDGVVFVSNREYQRIFQTKYNWDETFYLDLYYTQNVDSTEEYFSRFHKRINTIYHEGPCAFYDNDNKMIFTRNNFNQGRRKLSEEGVNKLKLYYSERKTKEEKWTVAVELPFNHDDYSVGHPTITSDGKRLYFASDRPGTYGEADIYYADWLDSVWSEPINLGAPINTATNDMFPFIFQDSILYFASMGHLGLGGLDIYSINLNDPNAVPENMGQPINSALDDFGLIRKGNTGFFSSNRDGGKGGDDIYKFVYTEIIPTYEVVVRAVDKETREIIPDANVLIKDLNTSDHVITTSLLDSSKTFTTLENVDYYAHAKHHEFFSNQIEFSVGESLEEDTLFYEIPMERIEIGKPIVLENIYYDLNKADIRPDAAIELDKLVELLVENPSIKIELSSHTDSRGSDKYNERLSQRRAESAVAYIISQGIATDRLTAKGYGEGKLVNACSNGVKCSDEEHQANRRTEFAVTENDSGIEVLN